MLEKNDYVRNQNFTFRDKTHYKNFNHSCYTLLCICQNKVLPYEPMWKYVYDTLCKNDKLRNNIMAMIPLKNNSEDKYTNMYSFVCIYTCTHTPVLILKRV